MTISLQRFEFRGEADEPHLLITGGVHGDEFEPIAAIRQLVNRFQNHSHEVAGLRGRVTLIPIVNHAAFLRGRRCAEDGLDLARTCPGYPDGSVTEQTAWALSESIRAADFYIDLHTGGTELSVFPLTGYMLHADQQVLEWHRRMARAFNLPVIWGTTSQLDGRSLSIARDANVPAIYCEYLGAATCSRQGAAAYVDGCLNVMGELNMLDRDTPPNRVQYVVENDRPNSGHMQACNPSPLNGYFEPVLQLGDAVRQGDPLGTVYPLDGGKPHVVRSTESGLLLVLRTFPRVRAGESVAVVLELPT